jgi:hypothetical protein
MKSLKAFPLLTLAAVLAARGGGKKGEAPAGGGTSKKREAPARSGRPVVSKATDDILSSSRTDLYVDHYRFGDAIDADGIAEKPAKSRPVRLRQYRSLSETFPPAPKYASCGPI